MALASEVAEAPAAAVEVARSEATLLSEVCTDANEAVAAAIEEPSAAVACASDDLSEASAAETDERLAWADASLAETDSSEAYT